MRGCFVGDAIAGLPSPQVKQGFLVSSCRQDNQSLQPQADKP